MPLQVVADPRDPGLTQADYDEQFRVSVEVADSSAAVRTALVRLRGVRSEADSLRSAASDRAAPLDEFIAQLDAVERELTLVPVEGGPIGVREGEGLDRQYGTLFGFLNGGGGYGPGSAEGRPTLGSLQRQRDLDQTWADVSQRLRVLLDQRWPEIKPPS